MEQFTNKLIRKCFVGNYDAWNDVNDICTNRLQRRLNRQFASLPESERYEIIPNFQAKFIRKVLAAHRQAELQITDSPGRLSTLETEAIRIKFCTTETSFDLSLGHDFGDWMWTCVKHDAIKLLDRVRHRPGAVVDIDDASAAGTGENDRGFERLREFQMHENQSGLSSENVIRTLLESAIKGDESIYMELWFDSLKQESDYPDPGPAEVISEIARRTGKTVNDAYVSGLKQKFLAGSYLVLIEHSDRTNSLAGVFKRLSSVSDIENLMADLMIKNVWAAFYNDELARSESRNKISPAAWARWEKMTLRKRVEEEILVAAYRFFVLASPLRRFCYLIELYADNRFGGGIRRQFGGSNQ